MVCLRNICINTLHKGYNDDDDNKNNKTIMDYKARRNNVAKILHKKLALKYSILN